ncbi:hypothetical protein KEM48_013853 [Puccinia striiformis f. sp. tritici PST-130]|nr:hypothetical protein KEM48_013853 [Puccinia striiformis f. sp. tritici PST-130]
MTSQNPFIRLFINSPTVIPLLSTALPASYEETLNPLSGMSQSPQRPSAPRPTTQENPPTSQAPAQGNQTVSQRRDHDPEMTGETSAPSLHRCMRMAVCNIAPINDRLALRIAAIFVILVTSILGTLFPVLTRQSQRGFGSSLVYEAVKYFGSGVILATALIHSNLDKFSEETATTRAGVPSAEVCSQLIGAAILELGVIFHSIVIGLTFRRLPLWGSLLYSFVTPLGLALGLALRNTYNPNSATALIVSGCLDSFSAGILLYTGLLMALLGRNAAEILARRPSLSNHQTRLDPSAIQYLFSYHKEISLIATQSFRTITHFDFNLS